MVFVEHDDGIHAGIQTRTNLVGIQEMRGALLESVSRLDKFAEERAADMGELRALKELRSIVDKKLKETTK